MKIFLTIVFTVIYIVIAILISGTLAFDCHAEDLRFLSKENAETLIKNAIPVGVVWPLTLVVLCVYSMVKVFRIFIEMFSK